MTPMLVMCQYPAMPFFDPRRAVYLAEPYPALARLRAEAPVFWASNLEAWVVTRYADCSTVLHDGARFTPHPEISAGPRAEAVSAYRASAPLGLAGSLGTTTGDEHRRLRSIVNPVFSPAVVHGCETEIAAACEEFVEALPHGAPFDFMEAMGNPLPKKVVFQRLGLPESNGEDLRDVLAFVERTRSNPRSEAAVLSASRTALKALRAMLSPAPGGEAPAGSVFGALQSAAQNEAVTPDEVLSMLAHIALVGSDPTSGALGNGIAALATRPELFERLRREPGNIRQAVHELLRFDSPTHMVARFAAADSEMGGRRIRRGDSVFAMVGAANRDPAEFERPDELDLDRDARRQLGFGQGEHICLGAPLALAIMQTALACLLARFERIELVAAVEYGPTVELRVPSRLMLRCE